MRNVVPERRLLVLCERYGRRNDRSEASAEDGDAMKKSVVVIKPTKNFFARETDAPPFFGPDIFFSVSRLFVVIWPLFTDYRVGDPLVFQ